MTSVRAIIPLLLQLRRLRQLLLHAPGYDEDVVVEDARGEDVPSSLVVRVFPLGDE